MVDQNEEMYGHLANLFSYPDSRYREYAKAFGHALKGHAAILEKLAPFFTFVEGNSLTVLEELFTKTFDLNPATCLEVGWHLYGEDYKRGEFLVQMRRALAEHHLAESIELPDHTSLCLRLYACLESEEAHAFAQGYLLPSIGKMLKGFAEGNPYRLLMEGLQDLLREGQDLVQLQDQQAGSAG